MPNELIRSVPETLQTNGVDVILFPQPGALIPHALKRPDAQSSLGKIVQEHGSILDALSSRMDPSRIQLVHTDLHTARKTLSGYKIRTSSPPDMPGFTSIRLGGQDSRPLIEQQFGERVFLRDLFTNIDGKYFFVDPNPSPDVVEGNNVILSPLGEGGKLIQAGKSILVSPDLWSNPISRAHLEMLRKEGYKVSYLPPILKDGQPIGKRDFIAGHIDGHANLILGKDGNPYLLYAKTYARQGHKAASSIRSAADFVGAIPVEVDDDELPPLVFNFIQLADGSVIVSGSNGSKTLEEKIREIVGEEKLVVTDVPIIEIPQLAKGSIRCMVNIAPQSFIAKFNPTVIA